MINCLIRCDFSNQIGYGHITRCLAIAEVLSNNYNWNINFAIKEQNIDSKFKIPHKYKIVEHCDAKYEYNEEKWLNFLLKKYFPNCIIFDIRTDLSEDFIKEIKKTNLKVISIDDPSDRRLSSDINFYPPSPKLRKMSWDQFKGINYIGWEYVILREQFLKNLPNAIKKEKRILISMGGSDPNNITLKTLKILNSNPNKKYKLEIIIGPGYSHIIELENYLKFLKFEYKIYKSPDINNFIKIVNNCTFAIVTFGVTAYEIVSLNLPSIHICLNKDHLDSSSIFEKEGVALSLDLENFDNLKTIINEFYNRVCLLNSMCDDSYLISRKMKQNKLAIKLFEFMKNSI